MSKKWQNMFKEEKIDMKMGKNDEILKKSAKSGENR